MTPEEKAIIKAEIDSVWPVGTSPHIIADSLNAADSGTDSEWLTVPWDEQHINVHKAVLLAAMTAQERANLRTALASDEDFKMLYEAAEEFTINHPTTIAMIDGLVIGIGLRSEAAAGIKQLGQRLKTRAEELIGRAITVQDIREAR